MKTATNILAKYSRIFMLLLICIGLSFATENFLVFTNIINVLRQSSMLTIMSLGMMCAMLLGRGVDISIGSTLAFSSCMAASFLVNQDNVAVLIAGIFYSLLIGIAIGVLNGSMIAYLRLPAILVTFGTREIFRGLTYAIMRGEVVTNLHPAIRYMGSGRLFGEIPMPIVLALLFTVLTALMLKRTRVGRELYLVGANPYSAKFSGIKTNRTIIFGFAASGLLSAIAGIIYLGRLGTAEGEIGQAFAFQSIGAVAIGGVSFRGGVGSAWGAVIGALIITLLINGMNLLSVSSYWQGTVNGAVIILAVLIDYFASKRLSEQ